MVTYFRPPAAKRYFSYDPARDRLMSRVPFEQGRAVLDNGGVCTPFPGLEVVTVDELEVADHAYMGAVVHGPLSAQEITNLVAAGYGPDPGPYLSATPP